MSLTMPNLSFHGQRELSTGLQLQQKVQNHKAISNCCLTRRQVGAKGPVIPPILAAIFFHCTPLTVIQS